MTSPYGSGLLRFLTCGSVDDGKSTLIGRLLYASHQVFEDQLEGVRRDSKRVGTQGDEPDLALLVDGLAAEREQGITIDVAYRYFSTPRRKFIVADTPGHEQYTRNMVTGASNAELAILLIDAEKGVVTQTRRHALIVELLGLRHVVLAVNKMDLVGYDQAVFDRIVEDYASKAAFDAVAIPVSALLGDNVVDESAAMPWYTGPTLLQHLEEVDVAPHDRDGPFRCPVQWVNRPDPSFRGFAGQVAAGETRVGDSIVVLPSGVVTSVERIVTMDGDLDAAARGASVTFTLADDVDVSRGDVLSSVEASASVADQFRVVMVWMSEDAMLPGRPYVLAMGPQKRAMTVTSLEHRVEIDSGRAAPAKTLALNEIGRCNISLDHAMVFDRYEDNRELGGFIVVDRVTNATVGAGMIEFALRRSANLHWQATDVDKNRRAHLKAQRPLVLWFTGLSGAGKSAIANEVEVQLARTGRHTYLLDGDNVRHGLNRDLGFTAADRVENIRRVAEVAKLMVDAGLVVLVSFISPFAADRMRARELFEDGEFCEVFVDTPLDLAESRDVKGLYAKARSGALKNFTGIDSPYERPDAPEIRIDTTATEIRAAAEVIIAWIDRATS